MKFFVGNLLIFFGTDAIAQSNYPVSESKAKKIVASVLKQLPVIDGQSDLFAWYVG